MSEVDDDFDIDPSTDPIVSGSNAKPQPQKAPTPAVQPAKAVQADPSPVASTPQKAQVTPAASSATSAKATASDTVQANPAGKAPHDRIDFNIRIKSQFHQTINGVLIQFKPGHLIKAGMLTYAKLDTLTNRGLDYAKEEAVTKKK